MKLFVDRGDDLPRAFGPYLLRKKLNEGGMAVVYAGTIDGGIDGFQKPVALKVIQPRLLGDQQFVRMLVHEAKLSAALSHQNIAQTYQLGAIDGRYFIEMEYVLGCDLEHVLHGLRSVGERMSIEVALYIASEVLRGLHFAHQHRNAMDEPTPVIHRDTSPHNVLLSRAGEVKVADFGVAKAGRDESEGNVVKGKYDYMSPEQVRGHVVDSRTDVFSMAVVLWEMLTGQSLRGGNTLADVLPMVRDPHIPPPSTMRRDVDPALDAIVARGSASDRDSRFASAGAFANALTELLDDMRPARRPALVGALVERFESFPAPDRGGAAVPETREGDPVLLLQPTRGR